MMEECFTVVTQCLILSLLYVCSLYVWKYRYDRDHPSTIKRRFVSVSIVALISPIYLYFCLNKKYLAKNTLWDLMGLRIPGIWQATLYPLLLTVILFLGPIVFQIVNGSCTMYAEKEYWLSSFKNVIWIRTQVVAPVSEEMTYRACMIPLLLQYFQPLLTIFICPVFFGTAHFNHFLENLKAGVELKKNLAITGFQFMFTTIFGAYCTFLFLRTGHLIAPIITHMFCNHMGFPDLLEPLSYSGLKRYVLFFTVLLGFAIWCILLMPITEPHLYSNALFWNHNYSRVENT